MKFIFDTHALGTMQKSITTSLYLSIIPQLFSHIRILAVARLLLFDKNGQ